MTNEEIHNFINSRNGIVGGQELIDLLNTNDKPQIDHVKYDASKNKIYMWTRDGDSFEVTPLPYEEKSEEETHKIK